jgi:hypothetical protein
VNLYYFLALIPLIVVMEIAAGLMLAFCVYYDARAEQNPRALMWALLCGFLGAIPAIVYLAMRGRVGGRMIVCKTCGRWVPEGASFCALCGQPLRPVDLAVIQTYRRRAKGFLIAWICVYAVVFLLAVALGVGIADQMIRFFFENLERLMRYS